MTKAKHLVAGTLCGIALLTGAAAAQDAEFVPETFGVKEAIEPGANIFVGKQEWNGASSIEVYSADDLTNKGNMTAGGMFEFLVAPDGKTAYTQSTYLARYTHGASEQVLTVYDVNTLSITKEILLPNKAAMVAAYQPMLEQSADGKLIFVQNATPATSVSVVDVAAGKVVQELPTPGCWGIYPSLEGHVFSAICGDGTFASFDVGADGAGTTKTASAKIFDPDSDPIFIDSERVGTDLAFISFHGNVYLLSDATGTIVQSDMFSIMDGQPEGWAPGGYQVLAYNDANGVLFVPMHEDAKDGSHKNASAEIWAYDIAARAMLYQSPAEGIVSLAVTDAAEPVLYGLNEDEAEVISYAADSKARFALKKTASGGGTGFATLVLTGP
jgi:methylamine dehydrogenase heavy chain